MPFKLPRREDGGVPPLPTSLRQKQINMARQPGFIRHHQDRTVNISQGPEALLLFLIIDKHVRFACFLAIITGAFEDNPS